TAFLKCSMASSYLALLYACTPLLSWSRAFSLLHPVAEIRARAADTNARTLTVFFIVCISSPLHNNAEDLPNMPADKYCRTRAVRRAVSQPNTTPLLNGALYPRHRAPPHTLQQLTNPQPRFWP